MKKDPSYYLQPIFEKGWKRSTAFVNQIFNYVKKRFLFDWLVKGNPIESEMVPLRPEEVHEVISLTSLNNVHILWKTTGSSFFFDGERTIMENLTNV